MQNRYVGDIGDYLKLGILRALSPGYHLGVAWWLFPDEAHNRDGRHIGYMSLLMAALRPRTVRHARKHCLIRSPKCSGTGGSRHSSRSHVRQ